MTALAAVRYGLIAVRLSAVVPVMMDAMIVAKPGEVNVRPCVVTFGGATVSVYVRRRGQLPGDIP